MQSDSVQAGTYIHQYTLYFVYVGYNVQQVIAIYMHEQSTNHISLMHACRLTTDDYKLR